LSATYYGIVTVASKLKVKALRVSENLDPTTGRATANRLLRTWQDDLARLPLSYAEMMLLRMA
jgi:hypothetical protein